MITAIGNLGTEVVRDTGRDAPVTITRDVPIGSYLVVWFATTNIFNVGAPTDGFDRAVCEDDKGNIYMLIGTYTHTDSFWLTGAMLHMHVCRVTVALDSGDVITPLIGNHNPGATFTRCASIEEFSISDGMRLAVNGHGYSKQGVNGAAEPGAISTDFPGPDREVLFVHGLAMQGPVTDTFTWDADYTEITPAGSNTGTPANDITVRGGYRIEEVAGNSDTVDVISDTDRPNLQVMTCLAEVRRPKPFPTTPILDDFNRADESPLDNGTWDTASTCFGFSFLSLSGNRATNGGSQWLEILSGCVEVYGTISDFATGTVMHFHGQGAGQLANFSGRAVQWAQNQAWRLTMSGSELFGQAGLDAPIHVFPYGNDGATPPDGTKLGVRRKKLSDAVWIDHLFVDLDGAGWEHIASIALAIVGTGWNQSGKLGWGTGGAWDDVGGGMISCPDFAPQIYRRPNE